MPRAGVQGSRRQTHQDSLDTRTEFDIYNKTQCTHSRLYIPADLGQNRRTPLLRVNKREWLRPAVSTNVPLQTDSPLNVSQFRVSPDRSLLTPTPRRDDNGPLLNGIAQLLHSQDRCPVRRPCQLSAEVEERTSKTLVDPTSETGCCLGGWRASQLSLTSHAKLMAQWQPLSRPTSELQYLYLENPRILEGKQARSNIMRSSQCHEGLRAVQDRT